MAVNVKHLSKLSNIPVSDSQALVLADQFAETIKVVASLGKLDTSTVEGTPQVTGLKNIFRRDQIDTERMLTQQQALSNAKSTYKGFFKVAAVLSE